MKKATRKSREPVTARRKKSGLPIERKAYRITEFCAAHGISRSKYFQLKAAGKGPRETRFEEEGLIIITEENARAWRAKEWVHDDEAAA